LRGINGASVAESSAGVIDLRMMPTECISKQWVAFLEVECEDVHRLMREGFFWSAENVLPVGGCMSKPRPNFTALGFRHQRTWAIAEKPDDGTPQWRGKVNVASPLLETLVNFRIQDLIIGKERFNCLRLEWRRPSDIQLPLRGPHPQL
jgi:hypothetical protein